MLGLRGSSVDSPSPQSQNMSALTVPTTNGHVNGYHKVQSNGYQNGHTDTTVTNGSISHTHSSTETRSESHATRTESRTRYSASHTHNRTFTSDQQITVLRQTIISAKSKLLTELKLAHVDEAYIDLMSLEAFVEYIESERLTNMPQRGSRWDKVLKWAEFFANQVGDYEEAVSPFVKSSTNAARLIWAACRILIELGPENAQAVETAFEVFYKASLSLRFFNLHRKLLSRTSRVRSEVAGAFDDLLVLVTDVSVYYRIASSVTASSVTIDFTSRFGGIIHDFYNRKEKIIEGMWACTLDDDSISIHAIRSWLSIQDSIVKTLVQDRATTRSRRDEYTCDWFQTPLLDFSRGKGFTKNVLAINGPSGCGKSKLSGWIVERLRRPLGKKSHDTLTVHIDHDIPKECTELAIVKRLALQLLQTNIGDIKLLEALSKAHRTSFTVTDTATLEKGLWDAVDIGLDFEKSDLMIIVDGLDDRCGKDVVRDVGNKICNLAARHSHIKAIILTRDSNMFRKENLDIFAITPDHTHNDVEHTIKHELNECQHFLNKNGQDRQAIIEKVTSLAKGNFLWAQLMIKNLRRETSLDNFTKSIEHASKSPKSLDQLVRDLIVQETKDFANVEAKNILSWLLVSRRPLTVAEVKSLLRVDLHKRSLVSRHSDVAEDIRESCGSLVIIKSEIVRFRHGAIRDGLLKISAEDKKLRHRHDLQAEFVVRLLAYAKFRLFTQFQCTFDCPDIVDLGNVFMQDALLEYATRNWISHFKRSALRKTDGTLSLTDPFKSFLPSSGIFPMMEWACWRLDRPALDAMELHKLALTIRQETFTEQHESVFQNLVICGHLHKRLSKTSEAGSFFYRASRLGQTLFKGYNAATISCTTAFLDITESTIVTTRTEVVIRREELLQYVITSYKLHAGRTSDVVIKYQKILAELYVSIKEEHKATKIWEELREVMIIRYGKGSPEELSISGHLNVVIKKGEKHEDISEYEWDLFDEVSEYEVWNIQRIQVTLKLASECEARGEVLRAEELYITLWRGLILHCQSESSHYVDIEMRISMIKVSLDYVRFLQRRHRYEEASCILICIWAEYEEYDFESEEIFIQLKIVGEIMRSVSLLSVAVSVFKKCLSWFKSHGKEEHSFNCQSLITETVEEIVVKSTSTTVTSKSTTTTTTTTTTEMVVKELFESSVSRSTVSVEMISICRSLVSLHMRNEQWSEAIQVLKRSLELMWKTIITGSGTIALPRDFGLQSLELAIQLAVCHHRSHHFHEAESIYLRLYRACFNSCQIIDENFVKAYTTLITFYTEYGHWHRVVSIYQEILVAFRKHLGPKHEFTISILYKLGSICHEHGHGNAAEYYEEIILTLNGSATVCHHDAFAAMKWICRSYYEQGLWSKLKLTCQVLWETWMSHHHSITFDMNFIEILYARYVYVLEQHLHVSYEILRTITIQYRETCIKVFGASASITIRSLIELAELCMRSEKYMHEAITHYEEVITITKTTATTTTTVKTEEKTSIVSSSMISRVWSRLTQAYIHVCSHGSATTTVIQRAIAVLVSRYESLKISCGYAHTETLTVLRELVLLHWKVKTKETHTSVVKLLQESIICILTKETSPRKLFNAAKLLAGLYLRCELHVEGKALLREIHLQLISRTYTSADKCGFKLDKSIGKACFAFLVTFEEIIQGSASVSYSRIMADLLTQAILYESYTACLKKEKNVEVVLAAGARYYCFLETTQWTEQLATVQRETYIYFIGKYGSVVSTSKEVTTVFITALLRVLGGNSSTIHISKAACRAANVKVRELLVAGEYRKAYEVCLCAFQIIQHQGAYHHLKNVPFGFTLAGFMALRNITLMKAVEPKLYAEMLTLSRNIIGEVLKACKDSKINFVRLKPTELNDLVGLLGEQENYAELEILLKVLWASREVQKSWSPTTITDLGARYICALLLSSSTTAAIQLCKAITYNVRRVYGTLDPKALQMAELLSQIYTKANMHRLAMHVHEEILRLVLEGDDDDDQTIDVLSVDDASRHLSMLKQTFLRNNGTWDKAPAVYRELVDGILAMPAYRGQPDFARFKKFDDWKKCDKLETSGEFTKPVNWEFVDPADLDTDVVTVNGGGSEGVSLGSAPVCGYGRSLGRPSMGVRRVSSRTNLGGSRGKDEPERTILVPSPEWHKEPRRDILVKGPELTERPIDISVS